MPRVKKAETKVTKKTKVKVETKKVEVSVRSKKANSNSLISILAIILVFALLGLAAYFSDQAKTSNTQTENFEQVAATQVISYDGIDGQNALELLKSRASVQTQDSSIGVFVTSINGIINTDTNYWMFYVNGELAPVSADQYPTKNSDKIEWRYDKIF